MSDTINQDGSDLEEFTSGAVPENVSSSGFSLALIVIGGTIGFAIFIVSAQIGGSLGYTKAALAFALGSLILGIMGAMTSYVGARSRLSTYLLTDYAFGRSGSKIANAAVAISLIGWYGVISNSLGQAAHQMLLDAFGVGIPTWILVLVASALMIAITINGFKGIDKLALFLVPVMLAFLLFAGYRSVSESTGAPLGLTNDFTFQTAVSAVVGSYIAGVIIQPDYSRFAKSRAGAIWSVFIALGIIFPLVMFLSALPSLTAANPDLLAVMATLGLAIPAFFLFALGAWASNVLCLYSSGLSIATMTSQFTLKQILLAIGVIGTSIAFVEAQSYLVGFLVALGVIIPPIGAVYLIDAFLIRRFSYRESKDEKTNQYSIPALASWGAGSAFGFISQSTTIQLTGIASIDTLIVTALVLVALERDKIFKK